MSRNPIQDIYITLSDLKVYFKFTLKFKGLIRMIMEVKLVENCKQSYFQWFLPLLSLGLDLNQVN